jgi:predicted site-specific integrase-resolvase
MRVSVIERMREYLGMKLAEWARANGVHLQPAYRWFRCGIMPDLEHRHRLARVGREDD